MSCPHYFRWYACNINKIQLDSIFGQHDASPPLCLLKKNIGIQIGSPRDTPRLNESAIAQCVLFSHMWRSNVPGPSTSDGTKIEWVSQWAKNQVVAGKGLLETSRQPGWKTHQFRAGPCRFWTGSLVVSGDMCFFTRKKSSPWTGFCIGSLWNAPIVPQWHGFY